MAWKKNGALKTAHAMVLVAYDEKNHPDKPWGFANSWKGQHMIWMSNADFRQQWSTSIATVGNNQAVIVSVP
jgi:hypothetical protein